MNNDILDKLSNNDTLNKLNMNNMNNAYNIDVVFSGFPLKTEKNKSIINQNINLESIKVRPIGKFTIPITVWYFSDLEYIHVSFNISCKYFNKDQFLHNLESQCNK